MTDYTTLQNMKGLKIVHTNVRSLTYKIQSLEHYFSKCDILAITESWLTEDVPSTYLGITGYNLIRQDRPKSIKQRGGGIAIYIKGNIPYKYNLNVSHSDQHSEIMVLTLNFKQSKKIDLIVVYRPPSGKPEECFERLTKIYDEHDHHHEIIILGDFNLDYSNERPKRHPILKNFESHTGLNQVITTPTRITPTTRTCLDLIFTNCSHVQSAGSLNLNYSDHLPVFICKKKSRDKLDKIQVTGRIYNNYNETKFRTDLLTINWDHYYTLEDPNELWAYLESVIIKCLDKQCPIKTFSVTKRTPKWINHDVISLMRDRDQMYRRARKHNREDDWNMARFLRNRTEAAIMNYRANIIKTELENNKKNPKKFWEKLHELLPSKSNVPINSLTDIDSGATLEADVLPDHINTFFSNIGQTLASKYPTPIIQKPLIHDNMTNLHQQEITLDEIDRRIREIDTSKSSGIQNLNAVQLKHALSTLKLQLRYLYNCSLRSGLFPDKWKMSTVVPLPKVPNVESVSDLRPIALLPLPGKILEQIVGARLKSYLEENNYLSEHQHGFRKGRSTTSSILAFLNDVYLNINTKKPTYAVFLDLKKAFDTISHQVLLNKLLCLNIAPPCQKWFSSYLSNRKQKVIINGNQSQIRPISFGVPQGSVLGPYLFIIYINQLGDNMNTSSIQIYADDTVLCNSDPTELKIDLQKVVNWCSDNLLTLNTKKTKWMIFRGRQREILPELTFEVNGEILMQATDYKYLGVQLDSRLEFEYHKQTLSRSINQKIFFLGKIRRYITTYAALQIYKTTILPIFDYADIIYDQDRIGASNMWQKLQNKALRLIYNNYYPNPNRLSTKELHLKANLLPLESRRYLHLLVHAFDLTRIPSNLDNRDILTRRREGPLLKTIDATVPLFMKSTRYKAIQKWNNLEVSDRMIRDKETFKLEMRTKVCNMYREGN